MTEQTPQPAGPLSVPLSERVGKLTPDGYALPVVDFDDAAFARRLRALYAHLLPPPPPVLIELPDGRAAVPLDLVLKIGGGDAADGRRALDQLTWRTRLFQRPPVAAGGADRNRPRAARRTPGRRS